MKSVVQQIIVFLFLITVYISCEKDKGPIIIKPNIPVQPEDTIISFNDDIQPIFDEHCVECHNQSHPFLDLRPLYSYNELLYTGNSSPYVDTLDPSLSYIVRRVEGQLFPIMPPDPPSLSQGKIDTLITWIRQGARNN